MEENKNQEYHFLKEETKKVPTNKKRLCHYGSRSLCELNLLC